MYKDKFKLKEFSHTYGKGFSQNFRKGQVVLKFTCIIEYNYAKSKKHKYSSNLSRS